MVCMYKAEVLFFRVSIIYVTTNFTAKRLSKHIERKLVTNTICIAAVR